MAAVASGHLVPREVSLTPTPLRSEAALLARWKVELPDGKDAGDEHFGGCRGVEFSYERLNIIGEGTYGQVYLAKDRGAPGTPGKIDDYVALKKIRMDNEKEGFPITAIREIKLLRNLNHENVINLREIVRSQTHKANNMKGSIYMVFDYMDHDLMGLMQRRNHKMPIDQLKCYLKQLLSGVAHCHHAGVLHRDLKTSNVLIDNKGQLKLADFGLARRFRDKEDVRFTNRVITLWYRPPELLLGADKYGPEVDMWSVGCIFAELLIGRALFRGQSEQDGEMDQLDAIIKVMGTPSEDTWPGVSKLPFFHHMVPGKYKRVGLKAHLKAINAPPLPAGAEALLEKLLSMDPKERMTAINAIKDEFFWHLEPLPCKPERLPTFDASHEMDMKRKRDGDRGRPGGQRGHGHDSKRARHGHAPAHAPGAAAGAMPQPRPQAPYGGRGFAPPAAAAQAGHRALPLPGAHGPVRPQGGFPPLHANGRGGGRGGRGGYAGALPAAAAGPYPQQQPAFAAGAAPFAAQQQRYPLQQQAVAGPGYAGQYAGGYAMQPPQPRPAGMQAPAHAVYGPGYGGAGGRPPPAGGRFGPPQRDMHARTGPPPGFHDARAQPGPSWQRQRR